MLLFPLTILAGIAAGWLRGGSVRALATLRLRLPGLLLAALILQVAIDAAGSSADLRFLVLAGSYGLLGLWLAVNLAAGPRWRRAGLGAVAGGYALNLVAILPTGRMPVSMAALGAVGGTPAAFSGTPNVDKHVAANGDAVWLWFGDVVPVPVLRAVISVGDVAILIGVVLLLCAGMTAGHPRAAGAARPPYGGVRTGYGQPRSGFAGHAAGDLLDVLAAKTSMAAQRDQAGDQPLRGPPADRLR